MNAPKGSQYGNNKSSSADDQEEGIEKEAQESEEEREEEEQPERDNMKNEKNKWPVSEIFCISGMVHCHWHCVHFKDSAPKILQLNCKMTQDLQPLSMNKKSLRQIMGAARISFAVWSGRSEMQVMQQSY